LSVSNYELTLGDEASASCPGYFTHQVKIRCTYGICWVDSRASLENGSEEKKIFLLARNQNLIFQSSSVVTILTELHWHHLKSLYGIIWHKTNSGKVPMKW